jgi:glycosyltransferase involved in cell wall biosynthesis
MRISMIICTYNRSYAIVPCLESIIRAFDVVAPIAAEIVVVDNASTDATSAIVSTWAANSKYPVRLVYEARKGLAAARNCGVRAAEGELLAFTDDDCRLNDDYIQCVLEHDSKDTGPVVRGGRVLLGDPSDLPLTIKTDQTTQQWSKALGSARRENLGNSLLGANMWMRRETAKLIGEFDENLGAGTKMPGGEDTDYFYRAYLAGALIEYVPDATIYHYHGRKKATDGHELMQNYMIGSGALYAKHFFKDYNLCRQFYWDIKCALKEAVSGRNNFRPDLQFSNRDKVWNSLKGIFRYSLRNWSH